MSRSSALIGGYLLVARETGLPLRVLETGASAGLNLRWNSPTATRRRDASGAIPRHPCV